MKKTFTIGRRAIGPGRPMYVIAEMSANHQQDLRAALEIVRVAKWAGADAIKLQTYTPDTLTIDCANWYFTIKGGTLWDKRTLYDLYGEAYMPWKWHEPLMREARKVGIDLFSSAYDASSVDYLKKLRMPAFKIASFENVDIPLLERVARTGKPVIVSTGMATLAEIDEAMAALRRGGCRAVGLMKCTSVYPAQPEEMNLRAIELLQKRYGVPIGLSDHTIGAAAAIAAAALGATLLEKHMTLDRKTGGADGAFSMEPKEFRAMIEGIRDAERALGSAVLGPQPREKASLAFRRSLFVVANVSKGERLNAENVRAIRPSHGLHTRHLKDVLGRRAASDIRRGTPLSWRLVGRR